MKSYDVSLMYGTIANGLHITRIEVYTPPLRLTTKKNFGMRPLLRYSMMGRTLNPLYMMRAYLRLFNRILSQKKMSICTQLYLHLVGASLACLRKSTIT